MAVPELKAKKVARAASQAKASAAAAKQAATDAAAFTKAITARAAAYEAEYTKVSHLSLSSPSMTCMHVMKSCAWLLLQEDQNILLLWPQVASVVCKKSLYPVSHCSFRS